MTTVQTSVPDQLAPLPSHGLRIGFGKSPATTLISLLIVEIGLLTPGIAGDAVLNIGLFAASGAITNWIAIHMLFEKIPGLYGSGVVQARFEEIRAEIRNLILEEFFDLAHVKAVLEQTATSAAGSFDLAPILAKVDLDPAWNKLVETVMASPLGGSLSFMGGAKALDPLRDPFLSNTRALVTEIASSDTVSAAIADAASSHADAEAVRSKIESIVDERVRELTPQRVKAIIQRMIKDYLGWLVVWGGVFGGALGLIAWGIQGL